MVTRDEVLEEIRRTGAENGGRPLGVRKFTEITGITAWAWGRFWATWGEAVRDAGFQPNTLNKALHRETVMRQYIEMTRELGRIPTHGELRLRRESDSTFPDVRTLSRRGGRMELLTEAGEFCREHAEFAELVPVYEEAGGRELSETEQSQHKTVLGFVYLARGRRGEYKIGRTNLVDRRIPEVGATGPVELQLVHAIKTDDSAGVEAYWHRRFEDQRMRGEWFRLSAADVNAFKRWRRIA